MSFFVVANRQSSQVLLANPRLSMTGMIGCANCTGASADQQAGGLPRGKHTNDCVRGTQPAGSTSQVVLNGACNDYDTTCSSDILIIDCETCMLRM